MSRPREAPPTSASSPPWLDPLRSKYTEMLRLRRGDLDGSLPDPRPAMAALAYAFPGALREMDRIPMAELERRLAWLERLHAGEQADAPEPWALLGFRYHVLLRGALAAKRWLAGRRSVDEELVARFREATVALDHGEEALLWADALPRLAAPPAGRLLALVLERLSLESGHPLAQLNAILFAFDPPPSAREGEGPGSPLRWWLDGSPLCPRGRGLPASTKVTGSLLPPLPARERAQPLLAPQALLPPPSAREGEGGQGG